MKLGIDLFMGAPLIASGIPAPVAFAVSALLYEIVYGIVAEKSLQSIATKAVINASLSMIGYAFGRFHAATVPHHIPAGLVQSAFRDEFCLVTAVFALLSLGVNEGGGATWLVPYMSFVTGWGAGYITGWMRFVPAIPIAVPYVPA